MSHEPELAVGQIVEYSALSGETSPAIICNIVGEPEFQVVELAAPPGLDEGLLASVQYSDPPSRGSWRFIPKPPRLKAAPVNPYGLTDFHPHWFSATELSYWQLCKRKWGYRYLERIKGQNKFAKRGTATHGFIEAWLKYGIVPPEHVRYGALARKGLKHLPPPRACEVERRSRYITRGGFQYDMSLDVSFIDPDTQRAVVLDHKTVTDYKWAMTAETLALNYQGLLYAAESFIYWDTSVVDLRWIYYKDSKKPASRKVETTLDFATTEMRLDEVDQVSAEIVMYGLSCSSAEELPTEGTACSQYGGCPYRDSGLCTITDEDILEAYMVQSSIRSHLLTNGGNTKPAETVGQQPAQRPAGTPAALERLRANANTPAATGARPFTKPAAQQPAPAAAQQRPAATQPAQQRPAAQQQRPAQQPAPAANAARPMAALSRLHAQAAAAGPAGAAPATQQAAPAAQQPQQRPAQQQTQQPAPAATRPAARRLVPAPQPLPEPEQPEALADGAEYAQGEYATDLIDDPPATFDASSEHEATDINPPEQPENPTEDSDQLNAENAAVNPVAPKKGRGRPAGSGNIKPVSDDGHIYAAVYLFGLNHGISVGDADPEGLAQEMAKNAVASFRAL